MSSHMAAAIRSATESETFDLAGNSISTIETTIRSAFASPLELNDMIRLTFVTGAGKLGRSKYDDDAAKTVTSSLRELGYTDDRGASCVVECAGSFKSQHDTGKNLKTIVVFPLIKNTLAEMEELDLKEKGPAILEEGSPQQLIAMASINTFEKMLTSKCPSWSQKKACVAVIEEVKEIVQSLDNKLMNGTPLIETEQEFYDTCDLTSLDSKQTKTKNEMQKQVEEGKITSSEKEKLLNQVMDKLQALEGDIKDATDNKKPKRLQKLSSQKAKLTERKETLDSIKASPPHRLKHQPDIEKLRKEMQPLIKLEKETNGRLLSIKEISAISRKEEIEDDIIYLEESSRGWFEEDADFELRIDASRALARTKAAAVKKVVKKTAGAGSATNRGSRPISWIVPGAAKKAAGRSAAKNKSSNTNAFAAMMMDSDSD